MEDKVGGVVRKKNPAPVGLQNVLRRLAKVALSNSPCCLYECFAVSLESAIDCRTLTELQLTPCESTVVTVKCYGGMFSEKISHYVME